MSFEELDPEVVADLRLRDATERDTTRTRPTDLRYQPDRAVRTLPCRNKACKKPCELTETGQERLTQFTKMLLARGDKPIDEHDVLVCADCRSLLDENRAKRARERVEEMREVVCKLKASKEPDLEHELWRRIEQLRHPDPHGLREALKQVKAKSRAPRREDVLT